MDAHPPVTSLHARVPSPTLAEPPPLRRGKAPPIDPFDGETGSITFEDWLPTMQRAAVWNSWSDDDCLVQLAGHLRRKPCKSGTYSRQTKRHQPRTPCRIDWTLTVVCWQLRSFVIQCSKQMNRWLSIYAVWSRRIGRHMDVIRCQVRHGKLCCLDSYRKA